MAILGSYLLVKVHQDTTRDNNCCDKDPFHKKYIIMEKKTLTQFATNALQRTSDIFAAGHYSPGTAKNYLT